MTTPNPIASESTATYSTDTKTRQVRLFRNGANQAVRIPKELELPGNEALIHREGNKLIIEPVKPRYVKGSAAALLDVLNSMEPIDDDFPDVDAGLLPLDNIEL